MTRHYLVIAILAAAGFVALGSSASAQIHGYHGGACDPCGNGGRGGFFGGRNSGNRGSAQVDRPFPIGAVTDRFWETQQTNAEAADFIFYDHEFVGDTAQLTPLAKRHLEQ